MLTVKHVRYLSLKPEGSAHNYCAILTQSITSVISICQNKCLSERVYEVYEVYNQGFLSPYIPLDGYTY